MRICLWAGAMALVAVTASQANAQDGPALAPSGPWNIDYDSDSCALRRMFGEGEDRAYLEMRRFGPGLGLQTSLGSKKMTARSPADFTYRFSSDADWRYVSSANVLSMTNGFSGVLFDPSFVEVPEPDREDKSIEGAAYLGTLHWREVEQQAAAKVDSLDVRGAFHRRLTLRLGGFEKAIAALNDCVDELMSHWNIDVEAHRTLTRPAAPVNLPDVSRMIDYPPKMAREGMQGVVNIRLAVDETGLVTSCHIQMPLSDPAFEETSCADIQHELDFDPALDRDGKPIASYWITKVRFVISDAARGMCSSLDC